MVIAWLCFFLILAYWIGVFLFFRKRLKGNISRKIFCFACIFGGWLSLVALRTVFCGSCWGPTFPACFWPDVPYGIEDNIKELRTSDNAILSCDLSKNVLICKDANFNPYTGDVEGSAGMWGSVKGFLKNGKLEGLLTVYGDTDSPCGKVVTTIEFKNGLRDGLFRIYSEDRKIKGVESRYRKGKLHGISKMYFIDRVDVFVYGKPNIVAGLFLSVIDFFRSIFHCLTFQTCGKYEDS